VPAAPRAGRDSGYRRLRGRGGKGGRVAVPPTRTWHRRGPAAGAVAVGAVRGARHRAVVARVPSTTPARHAGLLCGTNDRHPGVPLVRPRQPAGWWLSTGPPTPPSRRACPTNVACSPRPGQHLRHVQRRHCERPHVMEPGQAARRVRSGRRLPTVLRQPIRLRPDGGPMRAGPRWRGHCFGSGS